MLLIPLKLLVWIVGGLIAWFVIEVNPVQLYTFNQNIKLKA